MRIAGQRCNANPKQVNEPASQRAPLCVMRERCARSDLDGNEPGEVRRVERQMPRRRHLREDRLGRCGLEAHPPLDTNAETTDALIGFKTAKPPVVSLTLSLSHSERFGIRARQFQRPCPIGTLPPLASYRCAGGRQPLTLLPALSLAVFASNSVCVDSHLGRHLTLK